MGQYYLIVNKTKKELINPHAFGDGAKIMEFGTSDFGTMTALALLLRQSSEEGGGDLYPEGNFNPTIVKDYLGRWAGDNITIIGQYDESKLYKEADESFTDISFKVLELILSDGYTLELYKSDVENTWFEPMKSKLPERIKEILEM